jgi:EmrB/QacA subfamily drug resistance transporter
LVSVLVLVVGNFMAVLDVTIVNVAVPRIQGDFGGSIDDVLWIATAYTLMLGVVVPVSSWLGDRFGLSQVYWASLAAFGVSSALCGLAWNLDSLIAFRVLQAVPGGIMPVVAMTLVYRIVPKERMGVAMGVFGLGTVFAPALGPVLGGYLVQYVDWRLVFYINTPIGLLGAVAAFVLIPKMASTRGKSFDVPGFLTVAAGLFAILLAASEGTEWGWDSYRIRMLLVFGVLSLALFVVVELQVDEPLLDLRVFRNPAFFATIVMIAVVTINLLALAFFLPVFLQQGQHKEAYDAGVLLLPPAICTGVLSPFVGRLYDKVGPKWLSLAGLLITGYGTYLLAAITPDMTREHVILWGCVRGIGLSAAIMPVMTAGLSALPPAQTNLGSALMNVCRQTAGALGLAVLNAVSSVQQVQLFNDRVGLLDPPPATRTPVTDPQQFARAYGGFEQLQTSVLTTSYANLFLVIAALTVLAAPLALLLRPPDRPADSAAGMAAGH